MSTTNSGTHAIAPFVPQLLRQWLADDPDSMFRSFDGTLAFIDISGFTELTERLTARGKEGAEQLTEVLDSLFTDLLEVARRDGAYLVKWGGDAVLLLFDGQDHAPRAARAALRMRDRLRHFGKVRTQGRPVTLRMSVGLHSGPLTFFLVGDPAVHRELIVCGPAATRTAQVEAAASPGQIGLSAETAALLASSIVDRSGPLPLLTGEPEVAEPHVDENLEFVNGVDLTAALSRSIREYLLTGELSAEHRKVSVAFVRFSGTDELLAREGPDKLAAALDECVQVVQHAADRHGVTFLESDIDRDGGKIMIVSGAPRSAGHDEDRLLRAARQIVGSATTLPLHVGLNRGAVFTGVLGPSFCRTYSVKGDAVNLAARVAARARPSEALVTMTTLAHSSGTFENEPVPPFRVKGKSAPVQAARLGSAVDERPVAVPADGELVGREVELSVLRSALDEAVAGTGALVEIVGEAGIGKSRLVQAMLTEADVRSFALRCDEYETATPYWPLRPLFDSMLGLPCDDAAQSLQDAVTRHDASLVPWAPLLARIVDVDMPSTPEVDALGDQFRQARLQEVAANFLIAALPEPIVLVIEDVHLMDDASVALLERMSNDIQSRPWLILVTRRDIEEGFQPEAGAVVSVRPTPLDNSAAAELAQAMGAADTLPASVIEALAVRAGGNPFFLRGLIGAAMNGADVDALPDTVEALITSQLDRLPAAERTVLRYASVLGMRFDKPALGALLDTRPMPRGEAMRRLAAFVHADGEGMRFTHQLVRDTAYESLPFRQRRTLHGTAGELLESRAFDPDEIAEVLSLHFTQAGRAEKAWHYSRIGAQRAVEKYAYVQAEELFARAVQSARDLPDIASGDLVAVNVALGDARFRIGHQPQALDSFRAARRALRDDPTGAALLLRREAVIEYRRGRLSIGLSKLTRGLRLLGDASGSDLAARSRLEAVYAGIRQHQGHYQQALQWAHRAEAHAARSSDLASQAEATQAVLQAQAMLDGTFDIAYAKRGVDLFARTGNRAGQSQALNNLAMLAWMDGRGAEALETFRRADQLATEAGDAANAASYRYNVGDVLLRLGFLDESKELLRRLVPELRSYSLEDVAASATRALGTAIALLGGIEEGTDLLRRARDRLDDLGEPVEVLETDAARVLVLLIDGDPQTAAALSAKAAQHAEALGATPLLPSLLRLRGAALSDLGEFAHARTDLERALDLAETHGRAERGFVFAELSRVAHRVGRRDEARRLADDAEAAFDELGYAGSERYPRSPQPM